MVLGSEYLYHLCSQTHLLLEIQIQRIKTKGLTTNPTKEIKLSTNVLHDRFHRSDGALATIKAHDLWEDIYITPGNDSVCASYKIMTIPTASRGKTGLVSLCHH